MSFADGTESATGVEPFLGNTARHKAMTKLTSDDPPLLCLRLGGFLCFAGWAWVHFYWEGPYGILLWQDATYTLANRFGNSWDEFVGSGANDGFIQVWMARIGWIYLLGAILSLTVRQRSWLQMMVLISGSALLAALSYAKYLGSQQQLPMLVEHGGQILIPVVLVLALTAGVRHRATVIAAKVAVVMVFAGHGLYALGWHWPTPANFFGMTSIILHVDSETARTLLRIAGALDLLVCIGLFVPSLRLASTAYAAVWGLLTALARPVAGMSLALNYWGADQFVHEAVLRAPHFMIPLYLLFLWKKPSSTGTLATPTTLPQNPADPQTCVP